MSFAGCMDSRRAFLPQELHSCVRSLCEKVIVSHPCDLWTAVAALLSLSPADLEQVTSALYFSLVSLSHCL